MEDFSIVLQNTCKNNLFKSKHGNGNSLGTSLVKAMEQYPMDKNTLPKKYRNIVISEMLLKPHVENVFPVINIGGW